MRCERKFVLPSGTGDRASATVRSRVPALTRLYPARTVSSLYFDTASFACYEESNAGISHRVKLRLRWYGELSLTSVFALEVKRRAGTYGWKQVHQVGTLDLQGLRWEALRRELLARVGPEARVALDLFSVPVLVTEYRREYFHCPGRGVRVTVDTGLRFFDQRLRSRLNMTFDQTRADFAIVEGKMDRSHEDEGIRLLRDLDLRNTRFSKYCFGVDSFARPS